MSDEVLPRSSGGDRPCKHSFRSVGAVALAALLMTTSDTAGAEELIRRFPYPFSHMITFASDVDLQAPWHGAAIHRVINEEIGLPVSDSLWVHGSSADVSMLFLDDLTLNERPSGVGHHSTFGLLVRQWHRGNIDSFHSWQEDSIYPLRQEFDKPVKLASHVTVVDLETAPAYLAGYEYRHLRLYFTQPPPDDLYLKLHTDHGRIITVGVDHVKAGRAVKVDQTTPPYMTEIIFGVPQEVGVASTREAFRAASLKKIEFHAPSCEKGCVTALLRIDRDGFSRRTATLQLPWLEAFNIRPAFYSSHGGWSFAQNYGPRKQSFTMKRAPGSGYESKAVPNTLRPLADNPDEHAYLSDLLRRLGVVAVWSYYDEAHKDRSMDEPVPDLTSTYTGFHDLLRTKISRNYRMDSFENFRRDLTTVEPRLQKVPLDGIYCKVDCGNDQGAVLGLLVALGLTRIESGLDVEHLWYTHFATGDLDFKRTIQMPLRPSAVSWLRRLAQHHYNFDGRTKPAHRVWVAPVGVVARYRIARTQIAPHLTVDPANSRVDIAAWKDPVTGRTIPDPSAGTRDLHGITIYVPDAAGASVFLAGRETHAFTRNAPDGTGRASITIVDDSTPTVLLDEVPLGEIGSVSVNGGTWTDRGVDQKGAASGNSFGRLLAAGGDAVVRWRPSQLDLRNITHLQLAYRKRGPGTLPPQGRFFLELTMADGGVVVAGEPGAGSSTGKTSGWFLPTIPGGTKWTRCVLPLAELRWPSWGPDANGPANRPPLPLGQVRDVRFGLVGAAPGEELDLDGIAGLRPNSNHIDTNGGKLVGGQVRQEDGRPAPWVNVEAVEGGGGRVTTTTDRHGYYFFYRQPAGVVLKIAALTEGHPCPPVRGKALHVRKDEAEVDIDLGACRRSVRSEGLAP